MSFAAGALLAVTAACGSKADASDAVFDSTLLRDTLAGEVVLDEEGRPLPVYADENRAIEDSLEELRDERDEEARKREDDEDGGKDDEDERRAREDDDNGDDERPRRKGKGKGKGKGKRN